MQYLLLFLEGIITFISPCLLPLLPVYVSFFAAGKSDKRRTLFNSIGFVFGFTIVFVTLGAFAGTVGRLLNQYIIAINILTGLVVILLGLNFLGLIKLGFLNRTINKAANVKDLNLLSSVIFGIVFSIGWTPCVGAFLGSALMMAARQGGTINGVLMLLVYSLGLGLPFIASAVLIDRLKGAFDFIKRNYKTINTISGMLLIVVGILMATGLMGRFISFLTFDWEVIMAQKGKILIGAAGFILFIVVAVIAYNKLSGQIKPNNDIEAVSDNKEKAPDFTMTDREGDSLNFSDLFANGKPIVLNFWASWCQPCKVEMPDFENVYKELSEEIQFVMLNLTDGLRETSKSGSVFIESQGYTFPVFFDTKQEGSVAYGIRAIPTTIFIDKDGYIVTTMQGAIDEEALRKGIDLIK